MSFQIKNAIGVIAIAVLSYATLLGAGCGGDGSERAVEWRVDHPIGPNRVRLSAVIEYCSAVSPPFEQPIVEYKGSDRVYIELRVAPEELGKDQNGCLLSLAVGYKTITLERDLDELVLFDASTDPPEQRWPTRDPLPAE